MATYTSFYDGQTLASKQAVNANKPAINGAGVMEYVIDFSTARFGATAIKFTGTDILELMPFPQGSQILQATCDVLVAEGATMTFDVGDTGTADSLFADVDGDVAAITGTAYLDAALPGLFHSTADTLRLALVTGSDIGTAKIRLRIFGIWGSTNV